MQPFFLPSDPNLVKVIVTNYIRILNFSLE